MPLVSTLGRQRKADLFEFQARPVYTVRPYLSQSNKQTTLKVKILLQMWSFVGEHTDIYALFTFLFTTFWGGFSSTHTSLLGKLQL